MTRVLFTGMVALGLATRFGRADTVISTLESWDGINVFWPFGEPSTAFYGQALTIPESGGSLVSYEFQIQPLEGITRYRTLVYAWDAGASRPTGLPLYQSGDLSLSPPAAFSLIEFTIPGGLLLTPGQQILLMFDAYTLRDSTEDEPADNTAQFGLVSDLAYAGGSGFILPASGEDFDPLAENWLPVGSDFAFRATFASVPEAGTWGACVAGMLGLGTLWLRRRRPALEV